MSSFRRGVAFALFVCALWAGCSPLEPPGTHDKNPPAQGFDAAHSDPRAIEIADRVMVAMGGRKAWDATRCLSWNFFGRRKHIWDKETGDYRLDDGERVVRMNLVTMQGKVWRKGEEVKEPEALRKELEEARSVWINDSYWLLMPYKLKDTGVTLQYKGEDKLPDKRDADVLMLTFAGVGDTPDNKYDVWVSKDRHLVEQWAYYEKASDEKPKFTTAWGEWKPYGRILLSGFRTDQRKLLDIQVHDTPPPEMDAAK
jgi:hypothetical protein